MNPARVAVVVVFSVIVAGTLLVALSHPELMGP